MKWITWSIIVSMTAGCGAVAPVAKRVDKALTIHGHTRQDPYFWLRDDTRKDPEMLAYLEAENAYAKAVLKPTEALQKTLFDEMVGRIKKDDASVPVKDSGYWYYTRYEGKAEYKLHCRKKGKHDAEEQIILNENELAKGHEYFAVSGAQVSQDGNLLAWAQDTVSRRIYTIRVKDLTTGETLADVVEGANGNVAWARDNKTFFYVRRDPKTLRSHAVYRHTLGTEQTADTLVFDDTDDTFYVAVRRSKSHDFVLISSSSTLTTEVRAIDARAPGDAATPVIPRRRGHEYQVWHHKDHWYIRSNHQAKNFRLVSMPVGGTEADWQEVVPHRDTVLLHGIGIFDEYLVVNERVDALRQLRIIKLADRSDHTVGFEEPIYTAEFGANREFATSKLRFTYTSLLTPNSVFEYDMATRQRKLLKQDEVLGGYDKSAFDMKRLWAPTRDGKRVPISLVYPKDFPRDGSGALYQYAYGSYGYSMDPWFDARRLSLLERGFAVAIVHVRGGQEMGRQWYEDGKLMKKLNTFTDFIDSSEHLIREGWTTSRELVAAGGSAGGMLMGGILNMRPDLNRAVHAAVPFVDVVTTMLDDSIPLTTGEYDEWGNPNEKPAYEYMLSYSPYDNVTAQAYPNILVTTGLHDSQVQYFEPAKWVARLRHLKTDDNALVLDVDMEAGHGGASGRFKRFEKTALAYAFFMQALERL